MGEPAAHVSEERRERSWGIQPNLGVLGDVAQPGLLHRRPGATKVPTACNSGAGFGELCGNTVPSLNPRQGPQPEDATDTSDGDRSMGAEVVNLFGSMNEYTYDSFYSLESQCWASASQNAPSCSDPNQPLHTLRGGSWVTASSAGARMRDAYCTAWGA